MKNTKIAIIALISAIFVTGCTNSDTKGASPIESDPAVISSSQEDVVAELSLEEVSSASDDSSDDTQSEIDSDSADSSEIDSSAADSDSKTDSTAKTTTKTTTQAGKTTTKAGKTTTKSATTTKTTTKSVNTENPAQTSKQTQPVVTQPAQTYTQAPVVTQKPVTQNTPKATEKVTEKVTEAPKPSTDWAKNLNKTEKAYYNLLLGKFTENDIKVVRQDIFDYANKKFGGKTGTFDLQINRADVPGNHVTYTTERPMEFYIFDDERTRLHKNEQGFMKDLHGVFTFGFDNTPFGIEYSTVTGQKINAEPTREKLDALIADAHANLDATIYHAAGNQDGTYLPKKANHPDWVCGFAINFDWVRSQENDPTCFDFYILYERYSYPTREDLYW